MKRTTLLFSLHTALLMALTLGMAPVRALAHSDLESSYPSPGQVIANGDLSLELRFSAAVDPAQTSVRLTDSSGRAVATSPTRGADERTVLSRPDSPLENGEWTLTWSAISADGHPVEGAFSFFVSEGNQPETPSRTSTDTTAVAAAQNTPVASKESSLPVPDNATATSSSVDGGGSFSGAVSAVVLLGVVGAIGGVVAAVRRKS